MNQTKDPKKKNGLVIPVRQLSSLTALAISGIGVIFMGGYFLGKQHAAFEYVARIEQDSLADHMSASLCSLYDPELLTPHVAIHDAGNASAQMLQPEHDASQYYAQLIGYGTQKAADAFAEKLVENNIPVSVKTRKSRTASGKERVWYQVVTDPFSDKQALEALTKRIAQAEKIDGIQIVSC